MNLSDDYFFAPFGLSAGGIVLLCFNIKPRHPDLFEVVAEKMCLTRRAWNWELLFQNKFDLGEYKLPEEFVTGEREKADVFVCAREPACYSPVYIMLKKYVRETGDELLVAMYFCNSDSTFTCFEVNRMASDGLTELYYADTMEKILHNTIDWVLVNKKIVVRREKSLSWLKNSLY